MRVKTPAKTYLTSLCKNVVTKLEDKYFDDVLASHELSTVWSIIILLHDATQIVTGKHVHAILISEDEDCHLAFAQFTQLKSFVEKTHFPLCEGNEKCFFVAYFFDIDFLASHFNTELKNKKALSIKG